MSLLNTNMTSSKKKKQKPIILEYMFMCVSVYGYLLTSPHSTPPGEEEPVLFHSSQR